MTPIEVLVVEDEDSLRHVIRTILRKRGFEVQTAGSGEEALEVLAEHEPSVALLDIILPGINGLQVLRKLKRSWPDCEVVMMTSSNSVDTAIQALRRGAFDYLNKPFTNVQEVGDVVQRAMELRQRKLAERDDRDYHEQLTGELADSLSRLREIVETDIAQRGALAADEGDVPDDDARPAEPAGEGPPGDTENDAAGVR